MIRISSHLCLGSDIGVSGNMYGGRLLYLMDEAAAIFAKRYTGAPRLVTRSFSGVDFHSPCKLGDILDFYADNPVKGNTSVQFDLLVLVEGEQRFSSHCAFVAVDENGRKTPIDWNRTVGKQEK